MNWIDVKIERPKGHGYVFVCNAKVNYYDTWRALFSEYDNCFRLYGSEDNRLMPPIEVTHWMYWPQPPSITPTEWKKADAPITFGQEPAAREQDMDISFNFKVIMPPVSESPVIEQEKNKPKKKAKK